WPDVPTQVLAGRDDRLFPVDFQRRVARERLGIEADEIGGGHLVTLANRSSWSSVSRPIEPPARCGNRHTGRVVEPPFVQQRDAHTRATASGSGRIRAGGVEAEVTFDRAGDDTQSAIDEAYHAKYDSYWSPDRRECRRIRRSSRSSHSSVEFR